MQVSLPKGDEMNDDVKKYLQEKYSQKLGDINTAQAFANLGDVIAGQRVGSTNPFFSEQKKLAYGSTLGQYEDEQERLAKLAQAQELMALRREALMQGAAQKESDRALRQQLAGQQMAMRSEKENELSAAQAKQFGLAEMGQKAEQQYQTAIQKGKAKGEFDPTSYGDIVDATSWVPNFLKSGSAKEAEAAKSAWVESYLRDASGAAIPPSERLAYAKDFFPEPGDTPDVVANKAELRKQKMQNALLGAGPSAQRMGGQPMAQKERKVYQGKVYELVGQDRNNPSSWKVVGE